MNPKKIHFFTLLCSIFAIFEWHDFKESDVFVLAVGSPSASFQKRKLYL